jgi:hypothetical protein
MAGKGLQCVCKYNYALIRGVVKCIMRFAAVVSMQKLPFQWAPAWNDAEPDRRYSLYINGIVSFTQQERHPSSAPLHQVRQFQEILVQEQTPACCQHHKRIRGRDARPARRNRAHAAIRVVEVNSVFTPVVAIGDQPEPLACQGMVRVNDLESCFAVVGMRCS